MYRTIKGVRYIHWEISPSFDRIKAYRIAGVRCREFKEEFFIAEDNKNLASEVYKSLEKQ